MAGTMRSDTAARSMPPCLNGVRPRWPEQCMFTREFWVGATVSMESGLDGRNNYVHFLAVGSAPSVSMESGLDGRNNSEAWNSLWLRKEVSMESGLDGRNNQDFVPAFVQGGVVSMESGLDGRNNQTYPAL